MLKFFSQFFHRFFSRRVDVIAILMEQEAIKLVDMLHGDREADESDVEGSVSKR